ncbi:MAG: hypothetical protein SFV15_23660 [Polyangiaceae bacterium]|nr:hypothetical protein [Polyangiaceae bacterium]
MKALATKLALLLPITWLLGCSGEATHVEQFALARQHSCALLDSGTVKCWGFRGAGALADGNPVGAGAPDFQLSAVSVQGLGAGATQIAVGETWSCALLKTGAVQCWGAPVGVPPGSVLDSGFTPPATVPGLESSVKAISANGDTACVLREDGSVWCWGANSAGQLGAPIQPAALPVPVTLPLPARLIGVGPQQVCAALVDNSIWCWGASSVDFFYTYTAEAIQPPVSIDALYKVAWQALQVNKGYACALAPDATLYCWGESPRINSSDNRLHGAVAVNLGAPVAQMSLGEGYACAILKGGGPRCWGNGRALGLGSTTVHDCAKSYDACHPGTLVTPAGVADARRIGAGFYVTCAERTDGEVLCWGENLLGTEGTGTRWDSYQPTPVLGL